MEPDPVSEALTTLTSNRDSMFAHMRYANAVGQLAHTIAKRDVRRRRGTPFRLRARPRIALAIAIAVCIPVATAAAYQLSSQTGWFGDSGMTENDTTEWLRSDAPDFGEAVAALAPSLRLPRGGSWQVEVERQAKVGRSRPGLIQVTAVERDFETYARCAWIRAWTIAFTRHEGARAASAAAMIEASAKWPATLASDGGGVVDRIRSLGAAAKQGYAGPLYQELAVNCSGFDLAGIQ
jgi:hypothetical protein